MRTSDHEPAGPGTKRRWVVTGAVAVASAMTLGLIPAAATPTAVQTGSGRQSKHVRVLHFDVQFSPFTIVDVPPTAQQPNDYAAGDYVVFSDTLLRNGTPVGVDGGTGVITKVGAEEIQVHYSLTISLGSGQIAAQGLASNAATKRLAVVGGTGRFVGAAGDLTLVENGDGGPAGGGTGSMTVRLTD